MVLDQTTKISLFTVIGSLPFIMGAILWLANIDQKATAASLEAKTTRELVLDIRDRTIRIEEYLSMLKKNLK